jgi:hypothetical protein
MSTQGYRAFHRFLLGSVTSMVLHESHCPVWTGAHLKRGADREFWTANTLGAKLSCLAYRVRNLNDFLSDILR